MTTPPSDPYETPGDNESAPPPRHGDAPPPYPGQAPPPYPGQTPPPYPGQTPPGQAPAGYPAGEYGQAPGYPPYGQPMAQPEPPASILSAVKLMYVGAALSVLWTLLVLTQRDTIRDTLDTEGANFSVEDLDAVVNLAMGMAIVAGLITVGLWILMARTNRAGKSWARIVATILGGLAIAFGLVGMLQANAITLVMNLALVVLAAWILVLLYRRESSEYYSAVSQRPRY